MKKGISKRTRKVRRNAAVKPSPKYSYKVRSYSNAEIEAFLRLDKKESKKL